MSNKDRDHVSYYNNQDNKVLVWITLNVVDVGLTNMY